MKLTKNDIEKITYGALRITEEGEKFNFYRFSEEQHEVYEREYAEFRRRAEGTASVSLDFYTDSEFIAFSYLTESKAGPLINYAFIDVWVDGMMVAHLGEYHNTARERYDTVKLPEGEKRVTLYLPTMFKTTLWDIELSDGASIKPVKKKYKALILGDSITHGYDAHFASLTYANTVIRELELDAVNQAIGGEVFRPTILGTAPLFKPDFITVALGTNDWGGHPAADEYFKRLVALYPGVKIFYISPIWRANANADFYASVEKYEAIAKSYGIEVISGLKILHNMPEMFTDGLHPSDLGFTQYANSLIKALRKFGIN